MVISELRLFYDYVSLINERDLLTKRRFFRY